MNPSNPSVFARPLFAFWFCFGITILAAAAFYSSPSRADVTINFSGCNSVSVSGSQVTCVVNSGTSSPSCSISPSPSSLPSTGGSVSLTANCSGFTPTSWAWTKSGAAIGSSASSISDSLSANGGTSAVLYTYGVTACAGATCAPATTTVSVQGTTGTGQPGAPTCSGFTKTLYIDLAWVSTDASTRVLTANHGGFNAKDALVVKLNPPGGSASYGNGSITMAEYIDPRYTRFSTISASPCDFTRPSDTSLYKSGTTLSYKLQVGGSPQAYITYLMPGVPYYLNVRNTDASGNQTCPTGSSCNMYLDFYKPPGT